MQAMMKLRTRHCALMLCLLSLCAVAAQAATADPAETQYRRHVARCNSDPGATDRSACLKSAGAARAEARRGVRDNESVDYQKNALMRCDVQPVQDRAECVARARGQGAASGSVQSGAIVRELVTTVPASSGK